MTSQRMASRIALITGAASGLGRATAERFVREGARVVLCDLSNGQSNTNTNANAEREILFQHNKSSVVFCPTDVTSEEQVRAALAIGEEAFGRAIDTVVNCAGIGLARMTLSFKDCDDTNNNDAPRWRVHDQESFEKVMRVNVSGTFNVVRLAVEKMAEAKVAATATANHDPNSIPDGVIINTASIAAYDGQIGQVAYAASKGAIVGMTLPLARDLAGHKIRINAIAPGLFRTPMLEGLPETVQQALGNNVPFPSRLGHPDEFAMLVQSIVENPMINGEVIRIDGALRMPPK